MDEEENERRTVDRRQLFVLVGIVLALLFLAAVLPFVNFEPPASTETTSSGGDGSLDRTENATENQQSGPDRDPSGGRPRFGMIDGNTDYKITFNRSLAPGADVLITVKDGHAPIEDVPVVANGKELGRTDQFGEVTTMVPYTSNFTVTALKPAYRDAAPENPAAHRPNKTINTSRALPTQIQLATNREPRPGERIEFTAHVDGVRVEDAPVSIDGERVGRTDEHGRYAHGLGRTERTNLSVVRGAASGSRVVEPGPLAVTIRPDPFSTPTAGQPVTTRVSLDGRPVEGAVVDLNGERGGTTDRHGMVQVDLPWASSAEMSVSVGELETTKKLTGLFGLYWRLGLVLVGGLVGCVVLGVAIVRFRKSGRARSFVSVLVDVVVESVVSTVDHILSFGRWLSDALGRLRAAFDPTPAGALAVISILINGMYERLAALFDWLRRSPASVVSALRRGESRHSPESHAGTQSAVDDADARVDVRAAWAELVDPIVRRPESRPPRELAAAVSERGTPDSAATTLADAFRDIVYGQANPEDRRAEVREALATIRTARMGDDDEEGEDAS